MLPAWWGLCADTAMLALESQSVIGLRLAKPAAGGSGAQAEAERMVSEKVLAAGEAALLIATGGSTAKVTAGYRRKVRQNRRRLMRVRAGE